MYASIRSHHDGLGIIPLIVMGAATAVSAIASKKKADAQKKKAETLAYVESIQRTKDPAVYGYVTPGGETVLPSQLPAPSFGAVPYTAPSSSSSGLLGGLTPYLPYAIGGVLLFTLLKKK